MAVLYFIVTAIVAVGGIWLVRRRGAWRPRPDEAERFREHCQSLLEMNKLEGLIAYTRRRIAQRPNHTYAHWYLARAFYLQKKWVEALRAFNEVARLDPSWIEDSVNPYVRTIEAKLRPRELPPAQDAPEQPRTLH